MLPTFLIIGAMKAGTTALYGYLRHHPQIFMAQPKEVDYFVSHRHRGVDWYEQHFEQAGKAMARGEASPNYSKAHLHPEVAAEIAEVVPEVKLIYAVRHPVDRMVSMYNHQVADGAEHRSIAEAFALEPDYFDTSRYAFQLRPYLDRFGRDQLLVVKSEDLAEDPGPTLDAVYQFLGIEPAAVPAIGQDANRAVERRALRRWAPIAVRFPPYGAMVRRSWRFRTAHYRLGSRLVGSAPLELPTALREELLARFIDDLAELRHIAGVGWD